MQKLPVLFMNELDEKLKVVYVGTPDKPIPYFNAACVETMLGSKSPNGSSNSRVTTVLNRIEAYKESNPDKVFPQEGTKVVLLNSVKPASIFASDGVYEILAVMSSSKKMARRSYYYNEAALFYVLTTAMTPVANDLQHWINGEVLPTIRRTGSFNLSRHLGIRTRGFLTDAIKRCIDEKTLDDKAYMEVTDLVYVIRFGVHSMTLRQMMCLKESENIREYLGQEDLDALCELEAKVSTCIDLGMSISEIAQNPRLIKLYRKHI